MPWNIVVANSEVLAIHAALLPTGEILYFGGDEHSMAQHDAGNIDHTRIFRLSDNAILPMTSPTTDVFCSGHAQLADGRIVVAGGTEAWAGETPEHDHALGFNGLRSTWIYQPRARSWRRGADLNPEPGFEAANTGGGRWYPTLLTLANGTVMTVFGHPGSTDHRHRNNTSEHYHPAGDFWIQFPEIAEAGAVSYFSHFLNYPRIHLLNDGRVFFVTSVNGNRIYDPATGAFTGPAITAPTDPVYVDWHCQSLLLPLLPGDGYRCRILMTGDVTARRIDLGAATPAWSATATRQAPAAGKFRKFGLAVLLPNGKVFITGGINSASSVSDTNGVLDAEIYEPGIDWATGSYGSGTDSWASVEPATVVRNYHSTALLMPDGRVWTAGSSKNADQGDPATVAEHRIEIYSPDYIAAGGRPQITSAPAVVSYNEQFEIETPQAANIQRVALMRCGSVTHAGDFDQRYVALNFTAVGATTLRATAPPSGAVAPPGYYLLWIIDQTGLPCTQAQFVRVTSLGCFIITDRSTFSVFEVDAFLDAGSPAQFDSAFFAMFESFMPHEIGSPLPTPGITFAFDFVGGPAVSGMAIDPLPGIPEDASLPPDVAQRFTWPFNIRFTNHNAFDTFTETRDVFIRVTLGGRSCTAHVRLMKQPNPYMIDGDPSWLSTDLRVFKVSAGDTFHGIPQGSGSAAGPAFITAFVNACRAGADNSSNLFETLEIGQMASQLDLATTDPGGHEIFNYAVARVRYRASATPAPDVRVFFRTFNTAATSLEYHAAANQPYARVGNGLTARPLLGTLGGELVSIPYFAQARVGDMATQTDTLNTRTIAAAGAAESWEFFGCWLDFNRTTPVFPTHPVGTGPFASGSPIQDLIRGAHICMAAEIHFEPDPIPEFATPGSSENLAQRNLAIAHSDNPGNEASHTVQHTFLLKPAFAPNAESLGFESFGSVGTSDLASSTHGKRQFFGDELLVRWHNLPRDSRVTFYFSDVDADVILAKAAARLGPSILSKVDNHTIECRVASDVAYIPVPGGRTTPIPGLMTITLPATVVYGDDYVVSVHHCSGLTRRVIGAFQISIPVRQAATILPEDSRTLSVLRRIAQSLSPADHWYPIFQRYLGQLSDHVGGLGGNPDDIHPNRDGSGRPEPQPQAPPCSEKWVYAALLAGALTGIAVAPIVSAPFSAIAIIIAIAFACRWWIRCRPRRCDLLTLTLAATAIAAALTAIAAVAGAGKPWTWIALMLLTIAVALFTVALALIGCCGCEEKLKAPARVLREIGLHALRKPERPAAPTPRKQRPAREQPALAQSPTQDRDVEDKP